ncbi:hypothetical protein CJU89_2312 [Yarrowia sp. B02]|nr:hypothetical protein CJU89_2312 [Yarrowia sp. B02]
MSISAPLPPQLSAQNSSPLQALDDHIQEFEWLRVVESVLADREYSETEITQRELEELIPSLDSLEISSDDDDVPFDNYIHFSPARDTQSTPRSIPEWPRKPGSFSPLVPKAPANASKLPSSPLDVKRGANGNTPRKPTKIPVLSSRLGPPIVPDQSGLSAFRANLKNSPLPKIPVFEDSSEDSNDSSVQIVKVVKRTPPSVSPPATPPRLGFAANVTQPLRRSQRLAEERYIEPRSPGRVCSPIRREVHLRPSLKVSGNQPSSSKLISSLHSALTASEPLGFYSANDLRARLEGRERETRDRFKRRTRRSQRSVKWAEELEW